VLARVVRFRRFIAAAHEQPAAGLAQLAAEVGYADQSHLNRECRELAGATPSELLAGRDVRSVQDGLVTGGAHSTDLPAARIADAGAALMEVQR
jgi:AraC-like DNA-binding protein